MKHASWNNACTIIREKGITMNVCSNFKLVVEFTLLCRKSEFDYESAADKIVLPTSLAKGFILD